MGTNTVMISVKKKIIKMEDFIIKLENKFSETYEIRTIFI